MNTVNITITLPEDIYYMLHTNKNKSPDEFIIEALKKSIQTENNNLDELLRKGYLASNKEDIEITKEFESADLENWE